MKMVVTNADNITVNIAGDETVSIEELAEKIIDLTGSEAKIKKGVVPDLDDDIFTRKCDNSQMKKYYKPKHTLDQGLLKTILYYEKAMESNSEKITEMVLRTGV